VGRRDEESKEHRLFPDWLVERSDHFTSPDCVPRRHADAGSQKGTRMTWRYVQKTGAFSRGGVAVAVGYSGNTAGFDNPDMQTRIGVGPIPCGNYTIGPPHQPVNHLGPLALPLIPAPTNEMFDRMGFFIHGDNSKMNHSASSGCIVLDHAARRRIVDSGDTALVVVSGV
jgi:Protein of unknown function (DUF2778)